MAPDHLLRTPLPGTTKHFLRAVWGTGILFFLLQGALQVAFLSGPPDGKDHLHVHPPAAGIQGAPRLRAHM